MPNPTEIKSTESIAIEILDLGTLHGSMPSQLQDLIKEALDAERKRAEEAEKQAIDRKGLCEKLLEKCSELEASITDRDKKINLYQAINSKPMTEIESEKIITEQRVKLSSLQALLDKAEELLKVVSERHRRHFERGKTGDIFILYIDDGKKINKFLTEISTFRKGKP